MVAAPTKDELLVVTQSGNDRWGELDADWGVLYHVRLDGAKLEAKEIVSGNNGVSGSTPVWNPNGKVGYYTYNKLLCPPMGTGICGIFTLDPQTEKTEQLLADSAASSVLRGFS